MFAERAAAAGRLPGSPWFHDHVHFTFDGDYLAAQTFLAEIVKVINEGTVAAPASATNLLARAACAEALGFSVWDELSVEAAMVRAATQPPYLDQLEHAERQARAEAASQQRIRQFQLENGIPRAIAFYRAALARRPSDWQIHFNFGALLKDFNDPQGALAEFTTATELMPDFCPARILLAQSLWAANRRDEAVRQLQEALRYDSEFGPAKEGLAQLKR